MEKRESQGNININISITNTKKEGDNVQKISNLTINNQKNNQITLNNQLNQQPDLKSQILLKKMFKKSDNSLVYSFTTSDKSDKRLKNLFSKKRLSINDSTKLKNFTNN